MSAGGYQLGHHTVTATISDHLVVYLGLIRSRRISHLGAEADEHPVEPEGLGWVPKKGVSRTVTGGAVGRLPDVVPSGPRHPLRPTMARSVLRALACALLLGPLAVAAQQPGDLAVVGFRADDPDEFAVVALAPIAGGSEIRFTDNGWQASGSFRANEGTFVYTVPSTGLAPGTVVSFSGVAGPAFAAAGDQLLVYTGPESAPSFVYALNVEGAAVWQADATSSNTSALPAGLVNGSTAVAVNEFDNVAYAGPTSGTQAELLAAIGDPGNWTGDDTARPAFPASFTVTGDGGNLPPGFTAALTDRDVVADVPFTFDYDAADADGDPIRFSLVAGPAGAAIDAQTGVLTWTPTQGQADRSYVVTAAVTDGEASAETTATLTVLAEAPNRAPVFSDPTYGVLTGTGAPVVIDYDAEDPEGGSVTYALVSGPDGAAVDAATGVFSWTASTEVGVYPSVVSATDADGAASRVDLFVGVQGTVLPGLELGALRAGLRDLYPARTLGYDRARDTLYAEVSSYPDGPLCGVYTGFCVTLTPGADPSTDAFNKGINAEHTWPQSMGAASEPQRSDMHILYPAKDNVNGSRGNSPYGEVPDAQTQTWYRGAESQTTTPAADIDEWSERGPTFFEPREAVKGDIARAVLYFAAIYEPAASQSFLSQQLTTLLAWDDLDPAEAGEAVRSGLIARYQGNVNPFVLDPDLAERAFLGGVATARGPGAGLAVAVYPNPARGAATLSVRLAAPATVRVAVYDALGRLVAQTEAAAGVGTTPVPLDLSGLPSGLYIARVTASGDVAMHRVTVVR